MAKKDLFSVASVSLMLLGAAVCFDELTAADPALHRADNDATAQLLKKVSETPLDPADYGYTKLGWESLGTHRAGASSGT